MQGQRDSMLCTLAPTQTSCRQLVHQSTKHDRCVLALQCIRTLEQQVSTPGPFADAFVGSNSLNAGQVKDWPGALTGEMLSQVTGCTDTRTADTEGRPESQPSFMCTRILPFVYGAM